jgi:hypothetical protein
MSSFGDAAVSDLWSRMGMAESPNGPVPGGRSGRVVP